MRIYFIFAWLYIIYAWFFYVGWYKVIILSNPAAGRVVIVALYICATIVALKDSGSGGVNQSINQSPVLLT